MASAKPSEGLGNVKTASTEPAAADALLKQQVRDTAVALWLHGRTGGHGRATAEERERALLAMIHVPGAAEIQFPVRPWQAIASKLLKATLTPTRGAFFSSSDLLPFVEMALSARGIVTPADRCVQSFIAKWVLANYGISQSRKQRRGWHGLTFTPPCSLPVEEAGLCASRIAC